VTSSRPARKPRTLSRGDELVLSSASMIVYDSGLAHRSQEITTSGPWAGTVQRTSWLLKGRVNLHRYRNSRPHRDHRDRGHAHTALTPARVSAWGLACLRVRTRAVVPVVGQHHVASCPGRRICKCGAMGGPLACSRLPIPANGAVTMWLTPEDAPRSGTDRERRLARS